MWNSLESNQNTTKNTIESNRREWSILRKFRKRKHNFFLEILNWSSLIFIDSSDKKKYISHVAKQWHFKRSFCQIISLKLNVLSFIILPRVSSSSRGNAWIRASFRCQANKRERKRNFRVKTSSGKKCLTIRKEIAKLFFRRQTFLGLIEKLFFDG